MKKLLILLLLLNILPKPGSGQYIFINYTELEILKGLSDTLLEKIIDKVYLKPNVFTEDWSDEVLTTRERDSILDIAFDIKIDVTSGNNKIIRVPDSLKKYFNKSRLLEISFKGYLTEFFKDDPYFRKNFNLHDFGFSKPEIDALNRLKSYRLDSRQIFKTGSTGFVIYSITGTAKMEYYNYDLLECYTSYNTDYNKIKCQISYDPVFADIYIIGRKEWVYNFNLSDPPKVSDISKNVLLKLDGLKIKKAESPLTIELNEKSYIILYNKNGTISFDHIEPSTLYQTRNAIKSKL